MKDSEVATPAHVVVDGIFGQRFRDAREALGLSQSTLAKLLREMGLSQIHATTIGRIEHGARTVSIGEAVSICSFLGVPLTAMVSESEPIAPQVELARAQRDLASARELAADAERRIAELADHV